MSVIIAISGSCLMGQGSIALDMLYEGLRIVVAILVQSMLKVGPQLSGNSGKTPLSGDNAPVLKPNSIQQSLGANYPSFPIALPLNIALRRQTASDQSLSLHTLTTPSISVSHPNI